jgi:hypothetical protein
MQSVHCQNDLRYANNCFISHKNCTKQSEGDLNISRLLVIISMFFFNTVKTFIIVLNCIKYFLIAKKTNNFVNVIIKI